MEKYKICPVCGTHNNTLLLECSKCEADLQNVPVVDTETEKAAQDTRHPSEPTPMVRVCECGTKNPVQSRICSSCGEDISVISPTADTPCGASESACRYLLSSLDGAFAYEIREGTVVIGRESEMREYLCSKPYVSRRHAELSLDTSAAVLTLKNINTTNYTFVNNKKISGDTPEELKDGDEIGLGGNMQNGSRQSDAAYFIVRIGSCI